MEEVAITFAKELKKMLKCGGYCLCKFTSNRPAVLGALPASDLAETAAIKIIAEEANVGDSSIGII